MNKQKFLELPRGFPTSSVTETTSIEIVTIDGRRLVTTYNWAITPFDFPRCNIY
ncbi:MAG TPA: hypothetical protein VJ656_00635 [Pyrinomonadaceae bacterium]|nr:hypothetical protein [Pyrinomonadaceae bacterium]